MPEAALTGLAPAQALERLLQVAGHMGGVPGAPDWSRRDRAEAMVEAVESLGLPARLARVGAGQLVCLEAPALVELADQSWVVLEAVRTGRFQVDTGEGQRWATPAQLGRQGSGRVLELGLALPAGSNLWTRLKPLFLSRSRSLVQLGACTLLLQGLALVAPAMTAVVLDRALPDGAAATLGVVVLGLALTALHQVAISWIRDRILLYLATQVEVAAERGFLNHVLRCPFSFLQGRTQGDLMQAFAGFAAARDLLPLKTVGVLLNSGLVVVYLVAMGLLLPGPSLVIVAVSAGLILVTAVAGRQEASLQASQVEAQVREHGLLIELVAGIATLKAAGAEPKGLARWSALFRQVLRLEQQRARLHLGTELLLGALNQGLAIALLIWGGAQMLAGTLRPGRLFAFLQLSSGFMAALLALVDIALILLRLRPQLGKAEAILAVPAEPAPGPAPSQPEAVPVQVQELWFRYSAESPWVLQDYQLDLEAGAQLTLAGPSGSGKSTLLRLLAGLYRPERGRIRVAGWDPFDQRQQRIYLPQGVQLCAGSILDNLRLFSAGAPLERILETAGGTGLDQMLSRLPMGLQTLLPPGGRTLSGGQRQLIALTGALAAGRPLLLLDEALANLDSLYAARVQAVIASGRWTVVAAHHRRSR